MSNIGHKNGGKITSITAIAHSTYKRQAEWHFVGRCEWNDGSHKNRPENEYDIQPHTLCTPDDGDKTDLEKALAKLDDYLQRNGGWTANGDWKPHAKSGRENFEM